MLLIEDKYTKAIKTLSLPENFGINPQDDDDDAEIYLDPVDCALADAGLSYGRDYYLYHGISKCVVKLHDAEMVIKIPFDGLYENVYNVETDDCEEEFEPFERAAWLLGNAEGHSCWDYCSAEYELYRRAVDAGFGQFFAHVMPLGEFCGRPCFLQEKVEVLGYSGQSDDASKKDRDYLQSLVLSGKLQNRRVNDFWACKAIEWYGEDAYCDFIRYAASHKLLNDLHDDNIGFRANGAPVILDWSGFNE